MMSSMAKTRVLPHPMGELYAQGRRMQVQYHDKRRPDGTVVHRPHTKLIDGEANIKVRDPKDGSVFFTPLHRLGRGPKSLKGMKLSKRRLSVLEQMAKLTGRQR